MRDSDTVARLGGDEFVILAEDIEGDGEAVALAERVLDALEHPFPLGSAEVAMLASVGISVARRPDVDPEAMLREADVAMYRAKGAGGRRLELFDESLRRELDAHMELEGRLRDALPQHELLLAYQPILRLAGGQALGVEALVRWRPTGAGHATNATVLASTFLPPAEDSELIVQIGNWVLHEACAQADDLAPRRHHDPAVGQHLRARADGARSRRARARGARATSACPVARCAWRSTRRRCCATPSARARR